MTDMVFEKGNLHVGRFWRHGDCIQITITGDTGFEQLTITQFREMAKAVEMNVENTKGAWWHDIEEGEQK
jgi:hypothetical protein